MGARWIIIKDIAWDGGVEMSFEFPLGLLGLIGINIVILEM